MEKRRSGILLHITSLPGKEGIGTLGSQARSFIDFLHNTGQSVWQILPVGPVGAENSPYLCYSAFAGNPMLIDLELLMADGLLTDNWMVGIPRFNVRQIDFAKVESWKIPLLRKAFHAFVSRPNHLQLDYNRFLEEHGWWLNDYAMFMAAKSHFGGISWQGWPDDLKYREPEGLDKYRNKLKTEIEFIQFVQFCFFRQWDLLRNYAGQKGIQILGDLPLYVGADSADVWSNTKIFLLGKNLHPTHVGGVPPDYFSAEGQLWGNPVFNWQALKETGYHWWIARMHFNLRMFDRVRIDHFRGLESFWAVEAGASNAMEGVWMKAGGREMLKLLMNQLGYLPLVAEDLGIITPEVDQLRNEFNLPGMRVLQFAFSSDATNTHLPHNFENSTIVYTGTHDNDTTWSWIQLLSRKEKDIALAYLKPYDRRPALALIEMAWASAAVEAIIPLQDLLELGAEARMNIPGFARGNWGWRMRWTQIRGRHLKFLKELTARYNRLRT